MAEARENRSPREDLVAKIDEYGVAVRHVFASKGESRANFSYTVGLSAVGHPEIVVEGLPQESAHAFLNVVAQAVRERSESFRAGTIRTDLTVDPAPIVFTRVDDVSELDAISLVYPDLERVEAVQLVWTDSTGRLPWHPGYNNSLDQQRLRGPVPAAALQLPVPQVPPAGDGEIRNQDEGVVAVSPSVLDGARVTTVTRTADGLWCFTAEDGETRLVGVNQEHLLTLDRALRDLAHLPAGSRATRGPGDDWVQWPEGSA